jgi:hypothetical protein
MNILDEDTYMAVHATVDRARRTGQDLVEALNERSLLLSPAARRSVQVEALRAFERDVQRWLPHEFVRRVRKAEAATPADMYEAMLSYLADYIKVLKEER